MPADHALGFSSVGDIWREHRPVVLVVAAVLLGQFALIAGLVMHCQRRGRAEAALRRSEARHSPHGARPDVRYEPRRSLPRLLTSDARRGAALRNAVVRCDNETIVTIVRDVTSRHQAEEDLHKAQAELAQAVRVRALGELAAGIAHEVNQPLTAIITNARAGLRHLDARPSNAALVRDVLQDIVADGQRASDVIARIRGLVKQERLRRTPLAINDVIDDVITLSGRMLRQRSVALRLDLARDLPRVVGDRVQLQQVLLNLVLNAADAMQELNGRTRALSIRSSRRDSRVTVSVRDSGGGLQAADLPRIFTPFFTTKPEGMGVGLSISRSIVEAHGGTLHLTSNSANGATFEVELPIAPASQDSLL